MMMFSSDEIIPAGGFYIRDTSVCDLDSTPDGMPEKLHVIEEKITIPRFEGHLKRPRLHAMMDRSLWQFGATLVSGRSGTGKTALAADFIKDKKRAAWYSVESPDIDWKVFSAYFLASIVRLPGVKRGLKKKSAEPCTGREMSNESVTVDMIEEFLTRAFAVLGSSGDGQPVFVVLDDLHHIFDSSWFGDFFSLLIASLPPNVHLLLICRGRPPAPLWRLRSKQQLNVIDEKLLAFSGDETEKFFKQAGLPENAARQAYTDSFGRIAKVKQIANRCLAA